MKRPETRAWWCPVYRKASQWSHFHEEAPCKGNDIDLIERGSEAAAIIEWLRSDEMDCDAVADAIEQEFAK